MKSLNRALGSVLVLACAGFLAADDEHHHHEGGPPTSEQLGRVSFANSCAPAVQESFGRALALLHSFWYEESEKGFAAVARQDAGCAIAYWGVAMSLYHPLWETPDAVTLKRGREALQKAGAIGAKTERERDYIGALAVFYRDSEKLDHETGAAAYARAMEQVYLRYPGDREAAMFYALSLLGSAPPHDTELANRKKAAAILEKVFAADPEHPGVAHYLIHAYDTPRLAALGLHAARRYAKIAPSSPHALHMPSHIFTRLGLWQESIDSTWLRSPPPTTPPRCTWAALPTNCTLWTFSNTPTSRAAGKPKLAT